MTASPHTIGAEQTMSVAHHMMREYRIRHLPVLRAGKVVGLVSDRDLNVIENISGVDPTRVTVEEAMSQDPYIVSPHQPLDEVVMTMASKKYGSAIVVEHEKVVGIFTTVDACRVFAELLYARLAK